MRVVVQTLNRQSPSGAPGLDDALRKAGVDVVAPFDEDAGETGVDAWFCEGLAPGAAGRSGLEICKRRGIPFLLFRPTLAAGSDPGCAAAVRGAARIVVCGGAAANAWRRRRGAEEVVHVPPFVDTAPLLAAYEIRAQHRAALASRLQLADGVPCLVSHIDGRDAASEAGARLLARALALVVMLEWQIVILLDGEASGAVRQAFGGLPRTRVKWFAAQGDDQRDALLVSGDAFLAASDADAALHVLLLAQGSGLSCVAVDTPEVRDRVFNGRTGRLAAANNPADFANAVGFLLRHPQFRVEYGQAARELVNGEHDVRGAGAALVRILAELC